MGLLDMLINNGSPLSVGNGSDPSINVGATQQSMLHAFGNDPGYSLNQNFAPDVTTAANSYNTGVGGNGLPGFPSSLDLDGSQPTGPLSGAPIPINNSFINGTYADSAPEGSHF